MKVYLDNKNGIELVFDYEKDIEKSKNYFKELKSDSLKQDYFKNFRIVDCRGVKKIELALPQVEPDEYFTLVKTNDNSFEIEDIDLDKLNRNKVDLSVWQLYGVTDLIIKIIYDRGDEENKKTKIFIKPSFVSERDLEGIITSLQEKKFINLSFEPSLKSFLIQSSLNNTTESHFYILRKVFETFTNFKKELKLNSAIKRKVVEVNYNTLCKTKGRLYAPQKIIINQHNKITKILDRKPIISYDLAENNLISDFFLKFLSTAKNIYENIDIDINRENQLIKELTDYKIHHPAYDKNKENYKVKRLEEIKDECMRMANYISSDYLYKLISTEKVHKSKSTVVYANAYNYNPYYKKIHKLLKLLNSVLSFNYFTLSDIEEDIEQLNELYQEWTIYVIESVLSSEIFRLTKTKDLLKENFTKKIRRSAIKESILEYKTSDGKYCIKIYNEKIYKSISRNECNFKLSLPDYGFFELADKKNECEVYNCYKHEHIDTKKYFSKKCPDMSMEIFEENDLIIPTKIITFDCKFSENSQHNHYKYAYADTIRLFKDNFDKPERIVVSANCIYWGKGKTQNFLKNEINCYDISLNPTSESNLEKFFIFLVSNNILPELR